MDKQEITGQIAKILGETKEKPLKQIAQIIEHFGAEAAQTLLNEALVIQANGGLLIKKGTRQRSVGGVFFRLAQERVAEERLAAGISPLQTQEQFPEFSWSDRMIIIQALVKQIGEVSSVKATLIGRPGKIERRENLVITTMRYTPKDAVSLPKGLPSLPKTETIYTVYIAQKQWNKVSEAMKNPDDMLIVEGLCVFDPAVPGIALFAQSATTKLIQRGLRSSSAGSDESAH